MPLPNGELDHDFDLDKEEEETGEAEEFAEDTNEEVSHTTTSPDILERLKSIESSLTVQQLLQDPAIRAAIEAKARGEAPKSEPKEEESDLTKDLPEDDPARKVFERLDKYLSQKLDSKLKVLDDRIKSIEGVATEVQRRDVMDQVTKARSKYKDFDHYKSSMLQLSASFPGLNVEDLYLLAKSRAGKLRLAEAATFSEKPTSQPTRVKPKPQKPADRPRGRRGFNEILGEALQGLSLSEKD